MTLSTRKSLEQSQTIINCGGKRERKKKKREKSEDDERISVEKKDRGQQGRL